jgi:lipopolysaccharide biosynthesis protein
MSASLRPLAFHLPQYHPIPENDEWWGKGFTEWTNVVKARPRFPGHSQPHLPADLGFYDLRLAEAREAQAALARAHGIHGFCYYHYWFNGRRLLERPVSEMLTTGRPNFPFCLCWANENWTRRWDGLEEEVLLAQAYSSEDDKRHIQSLLVYFRDQRYITVNGRPLLLVYRLGRLPDPAATIQRWRDEISRAGLPGLYVCNVESAVSEHGLAPRHGADAAVEFAPDWTVLGPRVIPHERRAPFFRRRAVPGFAANLVFDYEQLAQAMLAKPVPDYLRYPCVTPRWDNSPRRASEATIFAGSTPERYELWLRATQRRFNAPTPEENFIFINAWNEWAEGNHLEPCQQWQRAYLEATHRALLAP